MEKKFELPKKFAEKWLKALRSGEYKQGRGQLYDSSSNSYCCLGIAKVIGEIDLQAMEHQAYIETSNRKLPKELLGTNYLTETLSYLNDGTYNDELKEIYNLRHEKHTDKKNKRVQLNFNEIADFIEDNCELY